jgi:hypothetical protein
MAKTWRKFRVSPAEDAELEAAAERFQSSVSGVIRRAVQAMVTQQPVLSPTEFDELYRAREQFRKAGANLDSLLRQVYLYQNGVTGEGPEADEFRRMLDALRQAAAHYSERLDKYP